MGFFHRLAAYVTGNRRKWVRPDARDLLNSAPDGIVIVDAAGKIVVVNSQTEVLFGYSREELIGQPVEMLIPARFTSLHLKHRAAFSAEPRVRPMGRDLELFGRQKNGTEFPVEISLSPLQTETGIFVISTVRDITDRQRAEEQIRKLNAELAEALRRAERLGTTGDLAATMAREIDTSLDTLTRLLSKLETYAAANNEMKGLISAAQEEVMGMTHITGRALAIQRQHDTWKTS